MASEFDNFIEQLTTGDSMRDYQHAAKTFVDGLYRISPKFDSLFNVYIDVLDKAQSTQGGTSSVMRSVVNTDELAEIGLMAKTVSLPNFSVQTKVYNAYNRKNIAQERVNYEPVRLTFHDDSSDLVRSFWQRYYEFH